MRNVPVNVQRLNVIKGTSSIAVDLSPDQASDVGSLVNVVKGQASNVFSYTSANRKHFLLPQPLLQMLVVLKLRATELTTRKLYVMPDLAQFRHQESFLASSLSSNPERRYKTRYRSRQSSL